MVDNVTAGVKHYFVSAGRVVSDVGAEFLCSAGEMELLNTTEIFQAFTFSSTDAICPLGNGSSGC